MSKRRCDLPKNTRLQIIISILEFQAKNQALPTSEICSIVFSKGINVSSRTVLRDLNELSLFCPITEEDRNGIIFWQWLGQLDRSISYLDIKWRNLFLNRQNNLEQEEAKVE